MKFWYYYLHSNGDIIGKNPVVVDSDPSYFDSDFVEKVWRIDTEFRGDSWNMILDCVECGANKSRISELMKKWGINEDDAKAFELNTGQKVIFDNDGFPYRVYTTKNIGEKDVGTDEKL